MCCLPADTRGAFVQPALYEAFGLTVIEAMTCGLPCFATNRGGPAEIIKNGLSGYHIECAPVTAPKSCTWCCRRPSAKCLLGPALRQHSVMWRLCTACL